MERRCEPLMQQLEVTRGHAMYINALPQTPFQSGQQPSGSSSDLACISSDCSSSEKYSFTIYVSVTGTGTCLLWKSVSS